MVTDEQLAFYGILALAAFLVGLSKCGLAVMMGALITPLVAMVIPLDQAIGLMLPILILGDVLLLLELSTIVFVATSALFIAVLNLIKVPYYFYAGLIDLDWISTLIWIVPFVPLGVWTSKRLSTGQVNESLMGWPYFC
jgi:uncharacterized membrane protein YfcA